MFYKYEIRNNGTEDILPKNISKWYSVENAARNVAESFGFKEIVKDSGALCMAGLIEGIFELYMLCIFYHI